MTKRTIYISVFVVLILFFLVQIDRFAAQKSNNRITEPIKVETGDIIFRSYSYLLANSSLYKWSGMPGHMAIVISQGGFLPGDDSYSAIKVVEARYYDHSKKQKSNIVGINPANENFGKNYIGRRFILKTHLTAVEKTNLIAFCNSKIGKPYNFFAGKQDSLEYSCATFVRHALINVASIDIDSDSGKVFFPNDIFDFPLFLDSNNRIRF